MLAERTNMLIRRTAPMKQNNVVKTDGVLSIKTPYISNINSCAKDNTVLWRDGNANKKNRHASQQADSRFGIVQIVFRIK